MEDQIFLDTDILVDFLRNKEYALNWIKENKENSKLATTIINVYELYYGAFKSKNSEKNLETLESLIQKLIILNFSNENARQAAKQQVELSNKGNEIEVRDLFIACISKGNGFKLKTNNLK